MQPPSATAATQWSWSDKCQMHGGTYDKDTFICIMPSETRGTESRCPVAGYVLNGEKTACISTPALYCAQTMEDGVFTAATPQSGSLARGVCQGRDKFTQRPTTVTLLP